jgi:hypothetical protein
MTSFMDEPEDQKISYITTGMITNESARDFEHGADDTVVALLADGLLVDEGILSSGSFLLSLLRLALS